MKIESSQVSLSCEHLCVVSSERTVATPASAAAGEDSFRSLFRSNVLPAAPAPADASTRRELQSLLQEMIERLWALICPSGGPACSRAGPAEPKLAALAEAPPADSSPALRRVTLRRSEAEATRVSARGEVRTADGRRVEFATQLALERQFTQTTTSLEADRPVRLTDPLVLEFAGPAAILSGKKFRFDLDSDGCAETLPALAGGCGFLVFDRDGNGRADDGRELFGVASGDGFADLARLDADGNAWIDEADPDFVRLRVWNGAADGRLETLAAAGVGAIHLGRVDSPFALKDAAGELLGQIRQSGIWLAEDGRVGGVRQIDLAQQPAQEPGPEPAADLTGRRNQAKLST